MKKGERRGTRSERERSASCGRRRHTCSPLAVRPSPLIGSSSRWTASASRLASDPGPPWGTTSGWKIRSSDRTVECSGERAGRERDSRGPTGFYISLGHRKAQAYPVRSRCRNARQLRRFRRRSPLVSRQGVGRGARENPSGPGSRGLIEEVGFGSHEDRSPRSLASFSPGRRRNRSHRHGFRIGLVGESLSYPGISCFYLDSQR